MPLPYIKRNEVKHYGKEIQNNIFFTETFRNLFLLRYREWLWIDKAIDLI